MSTATRKKPKPTPSPPRRSISPTASKLRSLREDRVSGFATLPAGQSRVDREKGIIYGVKVLGRTSPNTHHSGATKGTRYTDSAIASAAAAIKEGIEVNTNHQLKDEAGNDRRVEEGLGRLVNPKTTDDGVYADLHCLTTHPMWSRLAEAAEKMPDAFALSINAWGRGDIIDGWYVVNDLPASSFQSVDLVRNGGTNRSLFESKETPAMTTLGKLCESHPDLKEKLAGLFKVMPSAVTMPVQEDAGEGKTADYRDHLHEAMKMCEDAGDHETAGKIHKLMKPEQEADEETTGEDKMKSDTAGHAKGPDSKKDGSEDEEEPSKQTESVKPKKGGSGTVRLTESLCKTLIAAVGMKEDPRLVDLLRDTGDAEKAAKALAFIREAGAPAHRGERPSGGGQGSGKVGTSLKLSDVCAAVRG